MKLYAGDCNHAAGAQEQSKLMESASNIIQPLAAVVECMYPSELSEVDESTDQCQLPVPRKEPEVQPVGSVVSVPPPKVSLAIVTAAVLASGFEVL